MKAQQPTTSKEILLALADGRMQLKDLIPVQGIYYCSEDDFIINIKSFSRQKHLIAFYRQRLDSDDITKLKDFAKLKEKIEIDTIIYLPERSLKLVTKANEGNENSDHSTIPVQAWGMMRSDERNKRNKNKQS